MIQEIFTPTEWNNLKGVMGTITHHIPENQMGLIWNAYQRIAKVNIVQPCSCPGSARYWREAVDTINSYIKAQSSLMEAGRLAGELNNRETP
jgi:hypothetical protein